MSSDLDEIDRILLHNLQGNARITSAELASKVLLSVSGVQKRLRKLEENGIIRRYATVVDREALGFQMLCFVRVILKGPVPDAVAEFDETVQNLGEILECHRLTGSADYLLKIVVRNREHLDHFLMIDLMGLRCVDRLETSLVLREVKETTAVDTMG